MPNKGHRVSVLGDGFVELVDWMGTDLRTSDHAQEEIRRYADAVEHMAEDLWPMSMEAWRDYRKNAVTLSAVDLRVFRDAPPGSPDGVVIDAATAAGMSDGEAKEHLRKRSLMQNRV